MVLAAAGIGIFIVTFVAASSNVGLPGIAAEFAAGIAALQAVASASTLSFAAFVLSGGIAGDRWGAKRIFIAGLVLFGLASALCGVAPGLGILLFGRGLQGVGAAMLVPCSLRLIVDAFPDAGERALAIGAWAVSSGVALLVGPLIGAAIADRFGWHVLFIAVIPVVLTCAWLVLGVRDPPRTERGYLDLVGRLAVLIASNAFVAAFVEGPVLGWWSGPVLSSLLLGVTLATAVLAFEGRRTGSILPIGLFRSETGFRALFVALAAALSLESLLFTACRPVFRDGVSLPGVSCGPLLSFVAVGSLLAGPLVRRYGTHRAVHGGLTCSFVGICGLFAYGAESPAWISVVPMTLVGFGMGIIVPAVTFALLGIEPRRAGVAAAILTAFQLAGTSLAIPIAVAVLAAIAPSAPAATMHAGVAVPLIALMVALVVWLSSPRGSIAQRRSVA